VAIYSSYRDDDNVLGLAGIASLFALIRHRYATAMSKEEQTERILGNCARFFRW
jgi:hypothetical protein